jgi:hypothetical protein
MTFARLAPAIFLQTAILHAEPEPPGRSPAEAAAKLEAPPANLHVIDDREPLPPLIPNARDLLSGHVLLGLSLDAAWPVGDVAGELPASDTFGFGQRSLAELDIGVSRSISVGGWGALVRYAGSSSCGECEGNAFAVGPFVRYHLVQGLRLNPWLLAGAGYRRQEFQPDGAPVLELEGVEWLRLEFGSDYYVSSQLGIAPFVRLSMSSFLERTGDVGSSAPSSELGAGVRVFFDFQGR